MEERCYNCGSDKHLALQCPYIKTDPTRKEEDMEFENRCRKCDRGFMANVNNARFCPECAKARTAERRALARDAYMAALGGLMTLAAEVDCGVKGLVSDAELAAIETVCRWDAFMAAVDAEGGE